MRRLARTGSSRASRRRAVVATAGLAMVAAFVVGTALPAYAHHPVLSGQTVCSNGDHLITWTIGNSDTVRTMHIDTAGAALGVDSFAVLGYTPDVPGAGTTMAMTTVPGASTGTVTLTVHAIWPADNVSATRTTTVTLASDCTGSSTTTTTLGGDTTTTTLGGDTTTTTIGGDTTTTLSGDTTTTIGGDTTTTTLGGDTTTTLSGDTTTTISGETTTIAGDTTTTGTPVVTQGSTSPTTIVGTPTSGPSVTQAGNPTGSLPFTGSSASGPIFGLLSLATGAVAVTLTRRRNRRR